MTEKGTLHQQVLDRGEVRLLSYMADDLDIVGAARVSKGTEPEAASKGAQSDERLIRFLMDNGHGSPFEHAVFRFFVKAPIFVVREWQRHRMASYNEQSGRYAEFDPEYYLPQHARFPSTHNKQVSVRGIYDDPMIDDRMRADMDAAMLDSFEAYESLMERGIARELARIVLPVSMYTRFWWTVNARSLMNFLALRNSDAAQWEIRQYAVAIEEMFRSVMPITHEAFASRGRVAP